MSLVLQDSLAFGGVGGGGGGGSGGVTDVKVDGTSVVTSGVANVNLSGKLDKVTSNWKMYGTNGSGEQTTFTISTTGVGSNTVPIRGANGTVVVGTPSSDSHATTKKYVDDADALKQDKTMVTIITATSVVQDLSNNYIYSCSSNMTSVELKITGNYSADFIAQFNFSSGSTATTFTAPNIWKWLGDDVSGNTFTPAANKRYSIMIYFDGAYIRGIVQAIAIA